MTETDDNTATQWEDLAEVRRYDRVGEAQEHALVILAMNRPCWVADAAPGYSLHAEPDAVPMIKREIAAYELEQEIPKPRNPLENEAFRFPAGWAALAIWMLALTASFAWQHHDPLFVDRASSSSTALIANHEWWRPFTSLFLHADVPHLVGNLLGGVFFGTLVSKSIGAARAWPMILASGTLGNALTSMTTYPESFVSIGASTAVFGALGILSGLGFASLLRVRMHLPLAKTVAPVIAGVVVLGLMGGAAPGEHVDVLGHVFGFACGLIAGFLTGRFSPASAGSPATHSHRQEAR